jgi:hypothetical protein
MYNPNDGHSHYVPTEPLSGVPREFPAEPARYAIQGPQVRRTPAQWLARALYIALALGAISGVGGMLIYDIWSK